MQADHTWIIPPMRTADVVANEKWIVWLNSLDPVTREIVMRHEMIYFDEFRSGRMSTHDVLEEARDLQYV